jgi:superfamily I DNA/RNA helicase/CRISPR/Cas system-associated exonuclease Cas4 (RecB family)
MKLNDGQSRAVGADIAKATNVVAGAGTGKTRVLVERYLRFIRDGIPPDRLLALTFTLKAAEEMRQRIFESIDEEGTELVRELYSAWIMNFHSFGYRLIREHAPAFGVDPGADVATGAELKQIERLLERRFLAGRINGFDPEFGGAIPPPAGLRSLFRMYLGVVNKCRGDLIPAGNLAAAVEPDAAAPYAAAVKTIAAVYDAYEGEMGRRNLIDFNDMISFAALGLRNNRELARVYRERFDHILVDEFQDTSTAQFELLRELSGDDFSRVTVVGDEKQSIYRWRDARVENIRRFPGEPQGLDQNYRSRQNILDLAHEFVCMDEELAARAVALKAAREEKPRPVVLFHPDDKSSGSRRNDAEARALAAWVVHLTGGPPLPDTEALVGGRSGEPSLGYGDVAVLLRAVREHKVLPAIERAFGKAGIPYVVLGGADATGTLSLELLYSYLSLLQPGDRSADLLHVLESRPFEIGQASLMEFFENRDETPAGATALLSDERIGRVRSREAAGRLRELRELLLDFERAHVSLGFRDFLVDVLEQSPFFLKLFDGGAGFQTASRLSSELMDICDTLESKGDLGLWNFLDYLRVALDDRSFHKDEAVVAPDDHVRIMTIHQAKGLEFPAVAVSGVRPARPDATGFFVSRESGVYSSRWEEYGRGYTDLEEREVEKKMRKQEERCLLYVAMTRARDYLFVSSPIPEGGKSLFADVLDCAGRSGDPFVTVRDVVDAPHATTRGTKTEPAHTEALVQESLSEWRAARDRLNATFAAPMVTASPLCFVRWEALHSYARCPLRFRYRYLAGLTGNDDGEGPEAPVPAAGEGNTGDRIPGGMKPAAFGDFVHRLLRDLMESRSRGAETPGGWIDDAVARLGLPANRADEVARQSGRLIEAFAAGELSRPGEDMKLEQPFQARLDRVVLNGIFDRVERRDGGWCVTDYKTGRYRESYSFQIAFYAWALGRIHPEAGVTGQICMVRGDGVEVRPVDVSGTNIESLARDLERSLSQGRFAPNPGRDCEDCPYAAVCLHAQT